MNGKRKNGYIHVNDVSTEKVQEEETEYDAAFEDLVDVWMSKSPQIWDDGGFRNATRDEVQYYADPENFQDRNADNFFQYLVLSQPAGLKAKEVNNKILYDKGILRGTGASFIQAGETHSMNEVYLLAHALHETGNGTAKLSTGVGIDTDTKNPTVIKDTGDPKVDHVVYNMYGIGANDNCALECGALYAYEQGWFTPEEAIVGGAKFISVNYIQAGQDTLYKMRWNPDSPGDHQYATDVNWALAQTYRIADLYALINNYVLFFDIPEYTGTSSGGSGDDGSNDSGNSLVAYPEGVEGTTSSGGDNLNLRSKPSTSSSVIDSIPDGSKVQVLGYATGDTVNGNNTWYKVIFDGNQGWAHSDFVELDNLLQVKEVDPHLNIRKSPDTNSDDIGSLESSQFVAGVLNKGNLVTDNGWYKVYIPGTSDTGWVHGDFINERK
ncbi:SH3 domain-containing protein [Piscibacillus salipiscarius]|uniref:SH3 domain-containing protein n=1 Tax=Piscibacillus salipiscarius TaxID=299480 RepID=UPI0006D25732|nr:SH3 domain-containing protein [Piscibacillus salipiscarius]